VARKSYLFTSESVSEGHPDKVCDRISDEVVDAFYREGIAEKLDPWIIRAACETLATTNRVIIAGEYRGPRAVTVQMIQDIARKAIRDIGYEQEGFHWANANIEVLLHGQSADIAAGVDAKQPSNQEEGAGDQGIMFGYACRETPELMPAPIYYSHKILEDLAKARKAKSGDAAKLGPDSKSQVTVRYEDGKPVGVTQIVVSHQHVVEDLSSSDVRGIIEPFVRKALPDGWISKDTVWHINPTGKFFVGGPDGDTGLTGRKIIVDTYGGMGRHGGGAFSGKDPSKVDRSGAYAARWVAKNIVAAGLARRCEVQLAYAIGIAEPVSVRVDTFGTNTVPEASIMGAVRDTFDLTPRGIITALDLRKPIYTKTASYGHFGRKPQTVGAGKKALHFFGWERTDKTAALRRAAG
jgi:S-adenosylmethionine synthetase